MFFKYGEKEVQYLIKKDPILGNAINRIGMIKREVTPNLFEALISSIVSQQISTKAAKTVWGRFCDLIGEINHLNILEAMDDDIQKCGMSKRKVSYIKGIAEAAYTNKIDFNTLNELSNEDIIKKLVPLRGVGIWTVEMLLIFSLNREDVISYHDLGIRRGLMRLYNLETLTKKEFEKFKKRYSPYGSIASLYLWHISAE